MTCAWQKDASGICGEDGINEDKTGEEARDAEGQDQGSYFRTGKKASSNIWVVKSNWAGRWPCGYVQRGKK